MLEGFTWYKQAAYKWQGDGKVVYIDPWGLKGEVPQADLVLITHAHFDHFSKEDIERVAGKGTVLVAPRDVAAEVGGNVKAVAPGDRIEASGVKLQAVHAYNNVEGRLDKHPRANNWVGYVLELGGRAYYHAGDTDHVPELDAVRADVTFLPVGGGGYTMDVPEAAGLAKRLRPRLAVPMHYGWVAGSGSDGERFKREAQPVEVQLLRPVEPFER